MTHDTDYPKERVEEPEHGVFVPPDEQHVREDGAPTEPAESAEWVEKDPGRNDADRPEAIGTEAVPHPEPATPLDTGTAEDAERAEEMSAEHTLRDERVDDTGAEDEANARNMDAVDTDTRDVDADHMDARNVDPSDVDARNTDAVDVDAVDTDTRDVDARDVDAANVDSDHMDARDVDVVDVDAVDTYPRDADGSDVDGSDVDADEVAVGTASVPQQSTAPAVEFWPSGLLDDLRGRWDAVQMRFVDDPFGVAADAKALVGEAVSAIREAVDRIEARLEETVSDTNDDDTEQLRQKVAHYRDVFESLLSH